MVSMRTNLGAAFCVVTFFSMAGVAHAQPSAPATHAEGANAEAPEEDEVSTDLKILAGAQLASGNTQSYAVNGGVRFELIRSEHRFSLASLVAFGAAAPVGGGGIETNARNINSRIRYDYYLTEMDALFASLTQRWDTFAGLDMRLQTQFGYLRNFLRTDDHRLWSEVGLDITWDDFFVVDDTVMPPVRTDGTETYYSARLFLGVDSTFNEYVKLVAGSEFLFNFEEGDDVRVNAQVGLTTTLSDAFKLEILFRVQFDNVPVPGNKSTDTQTILNLVYDAV